MKWLSHMPRNRLNVAKISTVYIFHSQSTDIFYLSDTDVKAYFSKKTVFYNFDYGYSSHFLVEKIPPLY